MIVSQKPYAPMVQRPTNKASLQHSRVKNQLNFGNNQSPLEKFGETLFTEMTKTTFGALEEFDKHIPLPKNENAHIVVVSLIGTPAAAVGLVKGAVKGLLDLL